MTTHNATKGIGLKAPVNSLEPEHPLVTRWRSSLKDTALGRTSTSVQPQTRGSSHPIFQPRPRKGSWTATPWGFTSLKITNATLPRCTVGQQLAVNSTDTFLSQSHVPSSYDSYFLWRLSPTPRTEFSLLRTPPGTHCDTLHTAELGARLVGWQGEDHRSGSLFPFDSCCIASQHLLSSLTKPCLHPADFS